MRRQLVALLAVLIVGAPSTASAEVLGRQGVATPISALNGDAVWSTPVTHNGSTRYRLMLWEKGVSRLLSARSRGVPFDAQLGHDSAGRTVIVYSRCQQEPRTGSAQGIGIARGDFLGCHLYRYDLRTGRERRIPSLTRRGASDYLPSIDGRRIAFVRRFENRRGEPGRPPVIELYDFPTKRLKPLRGGSIGAVRTSGPRRDPSYKGGPWAGWLHLRGRQLAVGWEYDAKSCYDMQVSELWLLSVAGGRTQVSAATCNQDGDVAFLWSPVVTRDGLMFTGAGTVSGRVYLKSLSGGQTRRASLWAVAVAGEPDEVFAVQESPQSGFAITRSAPEFKYEAGFAFRPEAEARGSTGSGG